MQIITDRSAILAESDETIERLVGSVQGADHPAYGEDWSEWLDAQDWAEMVSL